jgi:hypothetical protein
MAEFTIECFQNEYLPVGGDLMHAIVTVSASGAGVAGTTPGSDGGEGRAELIIVDTSGSMGGKKLQEAKAATSAAIDCIPDGVRFGLISGTQQAEVVFPKRPPLVPASSASRREAKQIAAKLRADGGTAIGSWIHRASQVFATEPGIKHAILLTDGKNGNETDEVLHRVLELSRGQFQCDCRGVGADWEVAELRTVAEALAGTYDIVADPKELTADFAAMMADSMSRQVGDVDLTVWTPPGAETLYLKQMEPLMLDLTGTRVDAAPQTGRYATGSWGDESRDYHLCVRLPAGEVGDDMLVARVGLAVGGEVVAKALVRAVWTEDVAMSTRINRRVAEALGESELAGLIQEGIDSHRVGDVSRATDRFGRAVQRATEAGNQEAVDRLSALVDIEDAATGRVRPKAKVEEIDVMIAETRSTRTVRKRP